MSFDSTPEAERVHIRLLREAGQARRSQIASQMTQRVLWQARLARERLHPDLSPQQRDLLGVEQRYGKPLADKLRAYLQRPSDR